MKIKNIALVGNPNCGKTSLFNTLTGALLQIAIQADDFLFKKLLEAEYSFH